MSEDLARAYNRAKRCAGLADFLLGLLWLVLLLAAGWSFAFRDFAWSLTGRYWLALAIYALLVGVPGRLLGLPLDYYSGFLLEHRYRLSRMNRWMWASDELKSFVLGTALTLAGLEVVYALLRRYPHTWWLMAWAAFFIFVVALANLAPVLLFPLFYKFRPLEDEDLAGRLMRLSERARTRVKGVFEWKLSEKSRKANAALVGWGNTRRIILADTLLSGYTPEEVEAILAHELAHHVYQHIGKNLAQQAALSLLGFWLAARALAAFAPRPDDFAYMPVLALTVSALSLALLPLVNGISRHFERQADDYALGAIPSPAPFIAGLEKLAAQNLAERRPHPLLEFFFHSHPCLEKRLRRAQEFAGARGS